MRCVDHELPFQRSATDSSFEPTETDPIAVHALAEAHDTATKDSDRVADAGAAPTDPPKGDAWAAQAPSHTSIVQAATALAHSRTPGAALARWLPERLSAGNRLAREDLRSEIVITTRPASVILAGLVDLLTCRSPYAAARPAPRRCRATARSTPSTVIKSAAGSGGSSSRTVRSSSCGPGR